jgi:hypothetical protein
MEVKVLKNFVAFGRAFVPGDVFDIKDTGKMKKLMNTQYISLIEPDKPEKKAKYKASPKESAW